MSVHVGHAAEAADIPVAAKELLKDTQLRRNVRHATDVIRNKRGRMVDETADWEQLREAGRAIKEHTLRNLDAYLEQFEQNCLRAGGQVHWASEQHHHRHNSFPWREGSHQGEDHDFR